MSTPAHVSIVLPLFNDEEWIATALESCLAQTLDAIEIICVDDASTDGTVAVIESFAARDPRVRLVRQPRNSSAFQARRAGIVAAQAPYVLFLDGDDELAPTAAEAALTAATAAGADLVGFGVQVLLDDGRTVTGYQRRLAPEHPVLIGDEVLAGLFPAGEPAHGQLWRYLFSTELLRGAYRALPEDLVLKRVNDLPITFLAVAAARHYVSIPDQLYRYFFRRGGSGHRVQELSQFEFYLGAIDSVDAIAAAVASIETSSAVPEQVRASYASARLAIIGNVLNYLITSMGSDLHAAGLALLHTKVDPSEVVRGALAFCPKAIAVLAEHGARVELGARPVRSVLLTTKTLRTGGVSAVLRSQAHFLREAGCEVTVVATGPNSDTTDLPAGTRFVEITGTLAERVDQWAELCCAHAVDVIIDHQVLYSRQWPAYAVMARALGVPTVGWIHNFSLRPVYNGNDLLSFLTSQLPALARVVTLSPLDVAFWKLRGLGHAAYLPNPPSPLLLASSAQPPVKATPGERVRLVWWGRLEEHTKQVSQLLAVADHLRRLSVDFELTIIGPEWAGLTPEGFTETVRERRLDGYVRVIGPRHGEALVEAIDAADLFVTTSIIEGYQLTLAEAQARGLPVVMYDLPWLTLVQDNDGLVSVPQGDAAAMARAIIDACADPARYAALSAASIEAARRATSFDFAALYRDLVAGTLPAQYSPEPTLDDARDLLHWMTFYSERASARASMRAKATATAAPSVAPGMPRLIGRIGRRVLRVLPVLRPLARRARGLLARG